MCMGEGDEGDRDVGTKALRANKSLWQGKRVLLRYYTGVLHISITADDTLQKRT
jgi:hypothetical protein